MEKLEKFMTSKYLMIYQDDDYFKYNLDSILLADFVYKHYKSGNIIDLATGTLPIPLFLSYKIDDKIDAVELQKEVYELGKKTIEYNNLVDKINLINDNVNNINQIYNLNSFNTVICNPPYFDNNNYKKQSMNKNKAYARHNDTLSIDDIIKVSKYLLNNKGSLFLIYRTEHIEKLLEKLSTNNLEPKVIRFIYSNLNNNSKLFLLEARLNANKGCIIEKPLLVYDEKNNYSQEIVDIYGDE